MLQVYPVERVSSKNEQLSNDSFGASTFDASSLVPFRTKRLFLRYECPFTTALLEMLKGSHAMQVKCIPPGLIICDHTCSPRNFRQT